MSEGPSAQAPDDAPEVLVVAGEASGDAHAAAVIHALRESYPRLRCYGVGGDALIGEGLEVLAHARELSVVGLSEVLPRIPHILGILRNLARTTRARRPALAILVDSPDFNLRVAKKLRGLGVPILYYIAPQAWAWRRRRVHLLRRLVAQLAVVFPFEEPFFGGFGVPTHFVGHPLCDGAHFPSKAEARAALGLGDAPGPIVAVLPGSRTSEVKRHLRPMVEGAARHAPNGTLLLPVASTLSRARIEAALGDALRARVRLLDGQSRAALAAADCAIVASGTATLEAALAGTPSVVGYRVSWLTWQIARWLVRTPFVAMPNLLAGRALYPELLQGALTPEAIARALQDVSARADEIREGLRAVREGLGGPGASRRVADLARALLPPGARR